jgi:hypothetical protein
VFDVCVCGVCWSIGFSIYLNCLFFQHVVSNFFPNFFSRLLATAGFEPTTSRSVVECSNSCATTAGPTIFFPSNCLCLTVAAATKITHYFYCSFTLSKITALLAAKNAKEILKCPACLGSLDNETALREYLY